MYWALVDMLTSGIPIAEERRVRLKALVARLSEHVRSYGGRRLHSGVRRQADVEEMKTGLRMKLLRLHHPAEVSNWAVYGEGLEDGGKAILIDVFEGSYAQAVERALAQPDFVTEGMGGQIEPLGTEDAV
jgi:hypothetical protein